MVHEKRFLLNKLAKEERRKRKRKAKKSARRHILSKKKVRANRKIKRAKIWAPPHLTLQHDDTPKVLSFIENLKKLGRKKDYIELRLDDVTKIGEGAIAMLLAVINEFTEKGVSLIGEKPHNHFAKGILEKSGFFKYMSGYVEPENLKTKNTILRMGDESSSQNEFEHEIPEVMQTVWGAEGRCPLLLGGIGEMLINSLDHAFEEGHSIAWHLGITHIEKRFTVKFSFVDNGEGILKSYDKKGWLPHSIKKKFRNNAEILERAFKDGIESRTGLPWRGKGLPTIYEMYTDKVITNLVVITNNVYLDFDNEIFEELDESFSGTYYFWKIDQTCEPSYFV